MRLLIKPHDLGWSVHHPDDETLLATAEALRIKYVDVYEDYLEAHIDASWGIIFPTGFSALSYNLVRSLGVNRTFAKMVPCIPARYADGFIICNRTREYTAYVENALLLPQGIYYNQSPNKNRGYEINHE